MRHTDRVVDDRIRVARHSDRVAEDRIRVARHTERVVGHRVGFARHTGRVAGERIGLERQDAACGGRRGSVSHNMSHGSSGGPEDPSRASHGSCGAGQGRISHPTRLTFRATTAVDGLDELILLVLDLLLAYPDALERAVQLLLEEIG